MDVESTAPSLEETGSSRDGLLANEESIQEPLHDESHCAKRDAASMENEGEKAAKKRRRSSLSSKRRSIVNEPPAQETNHAEQAPESEGQAATNEGLTRVQLSTADVEMTSTGRLKVNPANLKMDETISQMEQNISMLNKECGRWKEILSELSVREEETKQLASTLSLPSDNIPQSVKDLAASRYISSRPLDLSAVSDKVKKLLDDCQFDREACRKDLQLIVDTLDTHQAAIDFKATILGELIDSAVQQSTDKSQIGTSDQIVQDAIDN